MKQPPIAEAEIDARIKDHVDELLKLWWAEQGSTKVRDLQILASAIPIPRDHALRTLDLACGPGDVGRTIRKLYPNADVDFVDRDPALLSICRGFNQQEGIPGTYRQLDLKDESWSDGLETGVYDVVAIANALHWLDEKRADDVIGDIHRLLRDGGTLVFAEPCCAEAPFAPGFDEWKSQQPQRYDMERWKAFWGRLNDVVGYDHIALLGSRSDARIGENMTVAGWTELVRNRDFGSVDVLWRDADVVLVAAQKS
jgi:SAM-dependent methyltransferase